MQIVQARIWAQGLTLAVLIASAGERDAVIVLSFGNLRPVSPSL